MKHVVVYGPAACGKTRNKSKLAKALHCQDIIDGCGERDLSDAPFRNNKTLFLTIERPHRLDPRQFEVMPFAEAMLAAEARS